jgi:hypothetical protein
VPDEDRIVHSIVFSEEHGVREGLNDFEFDSQWEEAELTYATFRRDVLGDDDSLMFTDDDDNDTLEFTTGTDAKSGEIYEGNPAKPREAMAPDGADRRLARVQQVTPSKQASAGPQIDMTEEDLVSFRRKVYLRIMSSEANPIYARAQRSGRRTVQYDS